MSSILLDIIFNEVQKTMAELNMPYSVMNTNGNYRSLGYQYFLDEESPLNLFMLLSEDVIELNMLFPDQSKAGHDYDNILLADLLTDYLVDCTFVYREPQKSYILRISFVAELNRLSDQILDCSERLISSYLALEQAYSKLVESGYDASLAIDQTFLEEEIH